jgi:hypothetical protein
VVAVESSNRFCPASKSPLQPASLGYEAHGRGGERWGWAALTI